MNAAALIQQWRELNGSHPSTWPRAWRGALLLLIFMAVLLAGWQFYLTPEIDVLEHSEHHYAALKSAYPEKYRQASAFAHFPQRIQHLEHVVATLEQQLQSFTDIDLALESVGDAALQNRLQFESARPGRPETKQGYVEAPIAIRVNGNYHDVGRFAADVAAMTPLVILGNMHISNADRADWVTLEAVVLAYRRSPDKEEKP